MSGPHIGTCKRCGKQTEYRYPSKVRDYCSHACSNAAKWDQRKRAETKTYSCAQCGGVFTRLAYQVTRRAASPVLQAGEDVNEWLPQRLKELNRASQE